MYNYIKKLFGPKLAKILIYCLLAGLLFSLYLIIYHPGDTLEGLFNALALGQICGISVFLCIWLTPMQHGHKNYWK